MYMVIDMKSFFASVECSLRGLNPQTTPLVVVDESRGKGAVVLAVSPYLKTFGVKNRCRLYEIPEGLSYIKAKPRMKYYIEYARRLHKIFLKYVAAEDIHTYSIDESFLYVKPYLKYYGDSPKALARYIMEDISKTLGVYSTCGCGDNMFLAKVALDIMAKHNGGYYYLNKDKFVDELWHHTPLTDFWQIGSGTAAHLNRLGIFTMGDIATTSPDILKSEFGVIGLELYDHAWGCEECMISDIKEYVPENKSISKSQILFEDYTKDMAIIPLLEMLYIACVELCTNKEDAKGLTFSVGYSKDYDGWYSKSFSFDYRSSDYTFMSRLIKKYYEKDILNLPIRRLMISLNGVRRIEARQLSLFQLDNENVITLSKAIGKVWQEYGRNSVVLGTALMEGSTIITRNKTIGGHNGE